MLETRPNGDTLETLDCAHVILMGRCFHGPEWTLSRAQAPLLTTSHSDVQDVAQIRVLIEENCCSAVSALVTLEALRGVDSGLHQAKADALMAWLRASLPAEDFYLAALWTANRSSMPLTVTPLCTLPSS